MATDTALTARPLLHSTVPAAPPLTDGWNRLTVGSAHALVDQLMAAIAEMIPDLARLIVAYALPGQCWDHDTALYCSPDRMSVGSAGTHLCDTAIGQFNISAEPVWVMRLDSFARAQTFRYEHSSASPPTPFWIGVGITSGMDVLRCMRDVDNCYKLRNLTACAQTIALCWTDEVTVHETAFRNQSMQNPNPPFDMKRMEPLRPTLFAHSAPLHSTQPNYAKPYAFAPGPKPTPADGSPLCFTRVRSGPKSTLGVSDRYDIYRGSATPDVAVHCNCEANTMYYELTDSNGDVYRSPSIHVPNIGAYYPFVAVRSGLVTLHADRDTSLNSIAIGGGENAAASDRTEAAALSAAAQHICKLVKASNTESGLVMDLGSHMVKCGFAGDDAPRAVFPSIVGRPRHLGVMVGMGQKDAYVGDEAQSKRGILELKMPFANGGVAEYGNAWEDLKKIYHHTWYNEMCCAPEEHPLLFTESLLATAADRLKLAELIFEEFSPPAIAIVPQPVLALYASGRTTGCVLSSGAGVTSAAPIFDGALLRHAVRYNRVTGSAVTRYLAECLTVETAFRPSTTAEMEIVRDIKEKLGFICSSRADFETEFKIARSKEYELPDGTVLTIPHTVSARCGEAMFRPAEFLTYAPPAAAYQICPKPDVLAAWMATAAAAAAAKRNGGSASDIKSAAAAAVSTRPAGAESVWESEVGIHRTVYDAVMASDSELHKDLYGNVVLDGGNTLFDGISDRLHNELREIAPGNVRRVHPIAPPERKYSVWIGGSIWASLSTTDRLWISKAEYAECGAEVVTRKSAYHTCTANF